MHPSEHKNRALTAALAAELDGFHYTASAFRSMALSFAQDAERWEDLHKEQMKGLKRTRDAARDCENMADWL